MSGLPQNEFINMPLDPHLLSTPFEVQTNWHVITGASCSGKTTLVDLLAGDGHTTNPEAGRVFFERELAKGRTIEEIRRDPVEFTRHIYDVMIKNELALPAGQTTFLDRGLPDGFAFLRIAGIDPHEILPDCFQRRYASVFMLERLPYQKDGVRVADDPTAAYLEEWTARDYGALGYNIIWVPVMPPEERLALVLENLADRGL